MKKLALSATGLLVLGIASVAHGASVISSTFDTDTEGWGVTDLLDNATTSGSWSPNWSGTVGLPAGSISTSDVGAGSTSFVAPVKFLGDKLDYVGGSISFDMRNSVANYDGGLTYPITYLYGSGILITNNGTYPTVANQWAHDSTLLVPEAWHYMLGGPVTDSDFLAVLGNLEGVYLNSDWGWGADTGWLDNVTMSAVPIPGALWLFGSALAGLLGTAIKRV